MRVFTFPPSEGYFFTRGVAEGWKESHQEVGKQKNTNWDKILPVFKMPGK